MSVKNEHTKKQISHSNLSRYSDPIVRLSVLTMANPDQMHEVLLFVCSKMADEISLSSKLPVADRKREI